MKVKITRTLFWFKDRDEEISFLDDRFFGLATLLNRLLIEKYKGKIIKFINLYFYTEDYYRMFPQLKKEFTHYYNGHFQYYCLFDLAKFNQLNEEKQSKFIWFLACENLKHAAKTIKNNSLLESVIYAYERGIEINLNADYKVVEADIELYGEKLRAAVWINFKKDGIYSKFTLEKNDRTIFAKPIDETQNGIEYFLEIYKGIEVVKNSIIIKGDRDIDYLPLKIDISQKTLVDNY